MIVKTIIILGLWLCMYANESIANTMENFPVPPRTQTWWVAKGNVHNGHELFIKRFKSQQAPEAIIEFYQRSWRSTSELPGYMQSEKEGWQLLSRLVPEYQWVVQIRSGAQGRGSEGVMSAMKLEGNTQSGAFRQREFTESIHGGDLLSSTESKEPSIARTQIHLYPNRPKSVANRFKDHMTSTGWSLQDEFSHRASVTQRYEKSKRQLDVALVEHSGRKTLVFFNEVIINDR